MATFSDILARERKKKGLSKAELARRLNIPYTTYQNYENGREPKIDVIKQISDELSICPSVFFDLENNDFLFDHSYHPVQHNELNDILLYDSGKFFDMKENFDKAMRTSMSIFGDDAFRKRQNPTDRRKPINKALFEVLSVYFAKLSETQSQLLISKKGLFKSKFMFLNNDPKFLYAISSGTGQKESVNRRYIDIKRIIDETLES